MSPSSTFATPPAFGGAPTQLDAFALAGFFTE
jgi:hypothetical protein